MNLKSRSLSTVGQVSFIKLHCRSSSCEETSTGSDAAACLVQHLFALVCLLQLLPPAAPWVGHADKRPGHTCAKHLQAPYLCLICIRLVYTALCLGKSQSSQINFVDI